MRLDEFYKIVGGNYETISNNLNDAILTKLLKMFLEDKSFSDLQDGINQKDAEKAFRGAHSLKGVCLNLDLKYLAKATSDLVEDLRGRTLDNYLNNYSLTIDEYNKVVNAIKQLN